LAHIFHKEKIGEKKVITISLDKMTNSFDQMVRKMDDKVDDENIQKSIKWDNFDTPSKAIACALALPSTLNTTKVH